MPVIKHQVEGTHGEILSLNLPDSVGKVVTAHGSVRVNFGQSRSQGILGASKTISAENWQAVHRTRLNDSEMNEA